MAEEKKTEVVEAKETKTASKAKTTAKKATTKKVATATTKKVVKEEDKKAVAKKVEKEKPEIQEYRTRKATIRDFEILFGPYVTEKTQFQQSNLNTIVLKVAKDATASEIKLAVQAVFGVKVKRVNIINVRPKTKRSTRYPGKVPGFKKAIVKVDKQYDLGEIAKATQAD